MDEELESTLEDVLEEALNSDKMTEVLEQGVVLEDVTEEERYFRDVEGGEETRLRIIRYNGKLYCRKDKNITYPAFKTQCIAFYELRP